MPSSEKIIKIDIESGQKLGDEDARPELSEQDILDIERHKERLKELTKQIETIIHESS